MDHAGATRHVRHVKLGDHLCLPFDNDDEQREVVAAFMVDGLARGERVLYFADRTSPEMIGSWLADRGIDAARAVADGRLEIRPVGGSYTFGGRFEPDIRLDLRELEFIDIAGVRAIVRTAAALPPGRRLLVARLADGLRKVFAVAGWDRTPGLVLEEEVDPP